MEDKASSLDILLRPSSAWKAGSYCLGQVTKRNWEGDGNTTGMYFAKGKGGYINLAGTESAGKRYEKWEINSRKKEVKKGE